MWMSPNSERFHPPKLWKANGTETGCRESGQAPRAHLATCRRPLFAPVAFWCAQIFVQSMKVMPSAIPRCCANTAARASRIAAVTAMWSSALHWPVAHAA